MFRSSPQLSYMYHAYVYTCERLQYSTCMAIVLSGERRDLRDSLPDSCHKGVFACRLGVVKITSGGIKIRYT